MPDLLPKSLVADLTEQRFSEFCAQFGSDLLLLISVHDHTSPLIDPLDKLSRAQPRRRTQAPAEFLHTTAEVPIMGAGGENDLTGPGRVEFLARLDSSLWFVLPLVKRQPTGDESLLTVGRTEPNDIILKHASVSARHAEIERYGDGSLSLRDLNSTNGTLVNGRRLASKIVHWLQPMDHLQFGSISTFTCLPNVLRGVLKAAAAAGL